MNDNIDCLPMRVACIVNR
uniref:Uncharacterized protein n=1 Tax=Lepeophtheirus salmonis TaxID=72036 RepID=A0A0K2V4Q9_LEPSM